MTDKEMNELKDFISTQIKAKQNINIMFLLGIIGLIIIILVSVIWFSSQSEIINNKTSINHKAYTWDQVFTLFVDKYEYETKIFDNIESENVVLKSYIDELFFEYNKDDMNYTYAQKRDIIMRDLQWRSERWMEDVHD